jgi:hypothetical protein
MEHIKFYNMFIIFILLYFVVAGIGMELEDSNHKFLTEIF